MNDLDSLIGEIGSNALSNKPSRGTVLSQDGTIREHNQSPDSTDLPEKFAEYQKRVDSLFNAKHANLSVRKEKPEHRLMLWLTLNGHSPKEIAGITGYSYLHVLQVRRQPWFQENFAKLSTSMGRDAVESFLEGEIIPTLERIVQLRDSADSDSVRLAASNAILDRIRGKPTVKVETKNTSTVDVTVMDAEKLLEESQRLGQQLKANGILLHGLS